MAAISIRLPDELESRLAQEARFEQKPRAEIARDAIADYLARKEHERFMAKLVAAARALASDPDAVAEAREIAHDFDTIDDGPDTLIDAERAGGTDHNEKWWK